LSDVLVDTDVLVDHMRGAREFRSSPDLVYYSILTRAELFAGRPDQEEGVRGLLATLTEVGVNQEIAENAGRIRRTTGVDLADAIIAATALHLEVPVVTRNRRDFERVPGLKLRAPR